MTMGNKELIATAGVGERVESGQFDLLLGAWLCCWAFIKYIGAGRKGYPLSPG